MPTCSDIFCNMVTTLYLHNNKGFIAQNLLDVELQVETDDDHVVEFHDEPHQVIEPVAESPSYKCHCCTNVAIPYHPLNLSESRTGHSSQRQGTTTYKLFKKDTTWVVLDKCVHNQVQDLLFDMPACKKTLIY